MVAQSQPTNYHCPAACQATKNRVILSPMDLRPLVEELGAAAQRVLGPKVAEAAGAAAANPASAAAEGPAAEAAAAAAQAFAQEAAAAAGVGTSDVKTSAEGPAADPAAAPAPDVETSDVTTDEKQELVIRYKHMGLHTDTAAWSMTFSEQLKRTQRVQSPLSAKQSKKST